MKVPWKNRIFESDTAGPLYFCFSYFVFIYTYMCVILMTKTGKNFISHVSDIITMGAIRFC